MQDAALIRDAGARKRRALARTRYQPQLGRAIYLARRLHHGRFHASAHYEFDRKFGSLSGKYDEKSKFNGRARLFSARASTASAARDFARGRVQDRAAQRYEGLGGSTRGQKSDKRKRREPIFTKFARRRGAARKPGRSRDKGVL